MSTSRDYLPFATGVSPIWIYGGPNNGGIWLMASFPDDTLVILSADQYWIAAPGIYLAYGEGGRAYATTDAVIMPPTAAEAQGMAMVISPAGKVNSTLLGTFLSPNDPSGLLSPIGVVGGIDQYASLPTSMAAISISGVPHLLVAGLFSYYLKASHAYTANGTAAIDLTTGLLNTGFNGLAITPNSGFPGGTVFPPKVFSDGAGNFGIHGIGNFSSAGLGSITSLNYFYSFAGPLPSGAGTFLNLNAGGITPPVATYGSSNFNGPFTISAAGAFGTAFPGALALCPPVAISAGVFMQDAAIVRPQPDPPFSGTSRASISARAGSISAGVFTVTVITSGLTGFLPTVVYAQGGTTGSQATISTTTSAAVFVAAFAAALYPECTFSFVSTGIGGALHIVITFTMPAGSTYYGDIRNDFAEFSLSGWSRSTSGGASGISSNLIALLASDGSYQEYIDLSTGGANLLIATGMAFSAGITCYAFGGFANSGNLQWSVKLLGLIRINIGLASPGVLSGSQGVGNLTALCPVTVVPFKNGFAISLPYLPIFAGPAGGAPL